MPAFSVASTSSSDCLRMDTPALRVYFPSVSPARISLPLIVVFYLPYVFLHAQDASAILREARLSPTASPASLQARIRGDGDPTPLVITLGNHLISYEFSAPEQSILLKLDPDKTSIMEKRNGVTAPLNSLRLHDQVRNTGVTYQDLSMGFLYWPRPILAGEETVKSRSCWKIDLQAPGSEPLYGVARVWVEKESGGILKIEGYDKSGKLLRRFEIISAQKIGGLWMLKQMRIESFLPGNPDPISRRYLEVTCSK